MDKEQLENLSIFELRDFARKIGVFNPTVLKKKDLISAIQDIQSGKTKPHISKTKQGRPPKEIGRLVNIFVPDDVMNIPTMQEKKYEIKEIPTKFYCNLEKPEDADAILYKGYFEQLSNGEGLLRKKIDSNEQETDRCYVKFNTIKRYKLKHGDEIVCYAYLISDDKPLLCDVVVSINNVVVEKLVEDRLEFDDLKPYNGIRKVDLQDSELNQIGIIYGDIVFAHNEKLDDFINFSSQFANKNKESFDKFIYLSPASKEIKYDLLRSFPDELYLSSFQVSFSSQQRTSFMAINRAKRLAEMGQNVCMFIQDILELVALDNNSPNGELIVSKDFLSSAKCVEKGSLTIVCGFKNIGFPYMRHKINSTFALIEDCGLCITSKGIDVSNSYRR